MVPYCLLAFFFFQAHFFLHKRYWVATHTRKGESERQKQIFSNMNLALTNSWKIWVNPTHLESLLNHSESQGSPRYSNEILIGRNLLFRSLVHSTRQKFSDTYFLAFIRECVVIKWKSSDKSKVKLGEKKLFVHPKVVP